MYASSLVQSISQDIIVDTRAFLVLDVEHSTVLFIDNGDSPRSQLETLQAQTT